MVVHPALLRGVTWTGQPVLLARLWALQRSRRTVTCELFTHPEGWELRLEGKHGFPRSRACATAENVMATEREWKAILERDGWAGTRGAL